MCPSTERLARGSPHPERGLWPVTILVVDDAGNADDLRFGSPRGAADRCLMDVYERLIDTDHIAAARAPRTLSTEHGWTIERHPAVMVPLSEYLRIRNSSGPSVWNYALCATHRPRQGPLHLDPGVYSR